MRPTEDGSKIERFDALSEDPGEIHELTRVMFGTGVRVERSDGRAPSLRLAQAAATDFGVQRVTWNVDGRCEVAPLNRFLCIRLHRGGYGLDQGGGRVAYTAGDTFLADPGRQIDVEVIAADLDSFTIELPVVNRIAAQIAPLSRRPVTYGRAVPVDARLGAAWNGVLDEVGRTLRAEDDIAENPLIRAGLLYRLVATACAAFELLEDVDEHPGTARAVRQAVAFIEEHLTEPISVGDIAESVGLSTRGLHAAFQRVLSTSPYAYLTRVRLHAARQDLLAAAESTSVTAVALRWGFTHLGRFASSYHHEFGELPSKTLRD